MKISLPVTQPPISSFPYIANLLSILWCHKNDTMPWISDHFIQLVVRPNNASTQIDFYDNADMDNFIIPGYSCPYIGWLRNNVTTANFVQFSDYIEYQISKNYYLDACLDSFYWKFSWHYRRDHLIHQTFIYGFDDLKKEVFISDFFDFGKYATKTVSYDAINKSIEGHDYFINLYKYDKFDYSTDLRLIKMSLYDYLNECDSLHRFDFSHATWNRDVRYGLHYYDDLCELFLNEKYIDIRPFHVLYDHKKLMSLRLRYLWEKRIIDKNVEQLELSNDGMMSETQILRNLVLKYNMTKQNRIKDEIIQKICILKEMDYKFTSELLKNL